jgi:hypothetical protein
MPRKKKLEDAGEASTAKAVGLTQEEQEALAKGVPATGPAVKMRGQEGPAVGGDIDDHAKGSEDDAWQRDLLVTDESHLSSDEKVGRLAQLYRKAAKVWLAMGLWILRNVFRNNLEDARSKNPNKQYSFKAIADHPELPKELKGDTLRRYVLAAATMKELKATTIAVDSLEYSHFREISKLQDQARRQKVARIVVDKALTARQTEDLVATELEKAKLEGSKSKRSDGSEDKFSALALEIISKLDDPAKNIIGNESLASILLHPTEVRTKFNFREQAKIYDKVERVMKRKSEEKAKLEEVVSINKANMKFLQDLKTNLDRDSDKTKTA